MKTKFKKNGRRLLAAILCLVMAVMALPMSAFAWTSEEGVSCTSSFGDYYVGSDGEYYRSKSSYSFIVYDSDGNISVRTISAGNAKRKYLMTDNSGTHQVYCVESGIDFNTGKAAGSFDAAKETERDILTCDENGFAQTKDMPYGIYTVHQVSGWEGSELMPDFDVFISQNGATYRYLINNAPFNSFAQTKDMPYGIYSVRQTSGWEERELMKPFDVFISKDGQTYRYLINNANFESYIKVVKKDAETGNTIPYAGAGFQIYDPNGNLVAMTFTYPEVTTIDTFYTTADGELITPQTLEYGKSYSLVEVQAPYGYVLNSEPVYFDVMQENSEIDSGITIIEVVRSNMAQKGTITVSKSGEVFSSVNEAGGLYQPVYAVRGLEGAVYEITAAEDIYAGRYAQSF